jgi:hypothetical protein
MDDFKPIKVILSIIFNDGLQWGRASRTQISSSGEGSGSEQGIDFR